ncbi:MAG: hypothetical protein QGH15_17980 [Kiritimatiellia bacterium]|nr:hypothetical protein [Kiritimatiellia bacterium]
MSIKRRKAPKTSEPRAKSPLRRKLIPACILLLIVLGLVEALCYFGLKVIDKKNRLTTLYSLIPDDADKTTLYDDFIASNQADVDLGWDEKAVVRGRPQLKPLEKRAFASAYGDSMAYSGEVEDDQSWEHMLEQVTGRTFLNLGVSGYGTDQSYLKFLKYYEKYPSDYVILGILPDDINRLLLAVPNYRWRTTPIVTKPRYVITAEGIVLQENPLQEKADYYKLLESRFLSSISQNDECYLHYKNCYGFDFVYGRRFPYTLGLLKAVIGQSRHGLVTSAWGDPQGLYTEGTDASRLMRHVIDEFHRKCNEFRCTPIVMIHCDARQDIEEYEYLLPFIEYIRGRGILVINIRDLFVTELSSGKVELQELLAPGGHYSFFANQIIAQRLARFFDLLAEGKTEEATAYYASGLHAEVDYVTAHTRAGLAYTRSGEVAPANLQNALYHCNKAGQLNPRNVEALFALGKVFKLTGHADRSRACFLEALRLQPTHKGAAKALGRDSGQD